MAHLCNFMYRRLNRYHLLDDREINPRMHDAPIFNVPFPNKETFKRSVIYPGSVTWNDLPVDTRAIKDIGSFKNLQKGLMSS